jgi:hypothetical protein
MYPPAAAKGGDPAKAADLASKLVVLKYHKTQISGTKVLQNFRCGGERGGPCRNSKDLENANRSL